jgi:hypothetical protein
MSGDGSAHSLSPRARDELQTAYLRIKAAVCAAMLWERVLTEAERQRLGGDLENAWRKHGTAGMWRKLFGVSLPRAVVDVACKLNLMYDNTRRWLLQQLGEIPDNPVEALQAAIVSGALVLVEQPREAHWRGQRIDVAWEKRSALWSFFWELCWHAKAGEGVDRFAFGHGAHRDLIAKQKSRLLSDVGFPPELGKLIKPTGRGTQKLEVPAEQIRLFEMSVAEPVRERTVIAP